MTKSFAKTVWDNLSAVNVNEHTDKKQNLTYLSWAWAWGVLMTHYPESEYEILPEERLENGTVECRVQLTIKDGENKLTRLMWLPVMDYKNKAVVNPDTTAINKTRMRCLAKAIAMFGLGHYIYAGEDIPSEDGQEAQKAEYSWYPDAEFKANFPKWKELIESGRCCGEDIQKKVNSKHLAFNDEQKISLGIVA